MCRGMNISKEEKECVSIHIKDVSKERRDSLREALMNAGMTQKEFFETCVDFFVKGYEVLGFQLDPKLWKIIFKMITNSDLIFAAISDAIKSQEFQKQIISWQTDFDFLDQMQKMFTDEGIPVSNEKILEIKEKLKEEAKNLNQSRVI